ncbi:MAG: hypothetical protein AB1626_03970 [Candidatus Micrarchaeota archaeon]
MLVHSPPATTLVAGTREIALDSRGENAFVSHAHADHASCLRGARKLICSSATLDLLAARGYSSKAAESAGEFRDGDLTVSLPPSGHVLGSTQLHAEWDSTSFTFTSDFKFSDSLTCKGARVAECEELLIEATYGLPRYSFPPREQVYAEIASWARRRQAAGDVLLLGGYSLGKAQELVKLLNDRCGVAPVVPKNIARVCRVYQKHGVKLDFIDAETQEGQAAMANGAFAAVLPHHKVTAELAAETSALHSKKVSCAIATGWALGSGGSERFKTFCLSDHADFPDLVRYAEESRAKRVLTMHGYASELACALKKKGINAVSLEEANKPSLKKWVSECLSPT